MEYFLCWCILMQELYIYIYILVWGKLRGQQDVMSYDLPFLIACLVDLRGKHYTLFSLFLLSCYNGIQLSHHWNAPWLLIVDL